MSRPLLNEVDKNVDRVAYSFNDVATPIKACGDVAYHVTNKSKSLLQICTVQITLK